MNYLRYIFLLQFATILALGQPIRDSNPPSLPNQPEALVRSLYTEVVARHPIGIPQKAEMKIFAPYLSAALHHRIDLFLGCYADWLRQNPDANTKHPFGVFESGLFSGADERSEVQAFQIERTQSRKDGSFRVYVRLTYDDPPGHPQTWRVAAIVVRENGQFVIDDVVYLVDKDIHVESRLSGGLSNQCNGPHWVGDRHQRNDVK
jgi:hypothetical protein